MTVILVIVVLVLLFGGGSYFYGQPGEGGTPNYPYRNFALPGIGGVLVILLVLYLLGVL